ncbi:uncharacterized protein BXZ73DRAFT_107828 [Epithele typhae]|uniref:uncharacterized protein n=1 Tax=Epithele typhae TaxID=378194 RepID=UPI0020073785|nr:uncharacterized protein BXZ73DRAFT_107828 [Epithele typhae]KAH9911779.1 hypothetical protein BXZ73DRAFT_107828 [Epithele typhae]
MSTAAAPFDVVSNVGPLFFAGIFDSILLGVLITKIASYFSAPKRDPTWIRLLVAAVLVTECAHTFLNVGSVYIPFVAGFGNYIGLLYANWASEGAPLTTGIVAGLVQWFFAWRIWILSGNKLIVGLITFFSIVQVLGSIGTLIAVIRIPFSLDFYKFQPIVITWCIGAVTSDLLITTTLVYYLKVRKTGVAFTDTLIDKISRLMIQTNLLTFIWNIIDLILYLRVTTTAHLVFNLTITKIYSLSLIVSLTSRDTWKNESPSSNVHSLSGTTASIPHIRQGPTALMMRSQDSRGGAPGGKIYIDVEAHEMVHVDEDVKSPGLAEKRGSRFSRATDDADVERGLGGGPAV